MTADSMGIIKVYNLTVERDPQLYIRATQITEIEAHRTGINDMWYANNEMWTASSDDTVQFRRFPASKASGDPGGSAGGRIDVPGPARASIKHAVGAKAVLPLSHALVDAEPFVLTGAGDTIYVYRFDSEVDGDGSGDAPLLVASVDAHWHDVTALAPWTKTFKGADGRRRAESWVVSASLDGTLRRWRLLDLINRPKGPAREAEVREQAEKSASKDAARLGLLTEEEERELEDLMDSD